MDLSPEEVRVVLREFVEAAVAEEPVWKQLRAPRGCPERARLEDLATSAMARAISAEQRAREVPFRLDLSLTSERAPFFFIPAF